MLAQQQIKNAGEDYEKLQMAIAASKEQNACFIELQHLVGSMQEARKSLAASIQTIENEKAAVEHLLGSTRATIALTAAALEREKARPTGDFVHHFWYDEKVERFNKDFAWAKRLTFLAMRAVEYEFQQSLPLRNAIVSAAHPDQLADVIRSLQQEQASRAINRRRPEESGLVVSLRDDILKVADRTDAPPGERNWPASLRFRGRLASDRYIIRDSNGVYLGQGVPFNLAPFGVLENRCGERLWRITATIQGDGLSSVEPGTQLMLLKRNTFESQYCSGKSPDGTQMQVNSILPSAQLFKPDPTVRYEEADGFSVGFMYPWFNIRRSDFYSTKYQEGASEELAGRGLYGDYILLFPQAVLEKGFPIQNVEDVLLRLDYLSVDNLGTLAVDTPATSR
jgi:hypothetical protein